MVTFPSTPLISRCPRFIPVWLLLLFSILFSAATVQASTLLYLQQDRIYLYYPEGEGELASGLWKKLPGMLAFLDEKGLPVKQPLHIIIDEERDAPEIKLHIIPHKEIRIPLRAPGVLENGYMEADPWAYFLFKGLCHQAIYSIRSGVPALLAKGFGELISPNVIIPPWVEDGIAALMYSLFMQKSVQGPLESAIFAASPPPDMDIISHHPQVWPGYRAYQIYGRPFIEWLNTEYGWGKILEFLHVHGRGIIPIEIDLKAMKVFGKTGAALWRDFQDTHRGETVGQGGMLITGYWSEPFVYWNNAGVFPGKLSIRQRGRYGYVESGGTVWISEFTEGSNIYKYRNRTVAAKSLKHVWDPGPGRVAVTRKGHRPFLIIFPDDGEGGFRHARNSDLPQADLIPAPAGVIQLSGPVRNEKGYIAVAANLAGNWDIWVHDGQWRRLTDAPSVELDPWWEGNTLVWSSNATGKFQIHDADQTPITQAGHGALFPRQGKYLSLTSTGWRVQNYKINRVTFTDLKFLSKEQTETVSAQTVVDPRPYNPFKSLWPNYIRPDLFAAVTDLQLGIATKSRDVSKEYLFDAGVRYSFKDEYLALRTTFQVKSVGAQYTRYPLSYETKLGQKVDESRNEIRLYWRPLEIEALKDAEILRETDGFALTDGLELSANWRHFKPLNEPGETGDEAWAALSLSRQLEFLRMWANLEVFTESQQSLSGGFRFLFGDKILSSLHLIAGRSWGEPEFGHTTFRVGGNLTEGYFTRRPSRLFPIRGFDSDLIEAPKAAAAGAEIYWPLANLQKGYLTLPLFLHRIRLGTFVDAGFAGEDPGSDDLLVGAGFEFITSLEIAWGNFSAFRMGVAWPLRQPDYLDQDGPKFVFQLGRPL